MCWATTPPAVVPRQEAGVGSLVCPLWPLTCRGELVILCFKISGLTHIITMDLHQKEIQGFFSFPVDNLRASPFLLQYIQEEVRSRQHPPTPLSSEPPCVVFSGVRLGRGGHARDLAPRAGCPGCQAGPPVAETLRQTPGIRPPLRIPSDLLVFSRVKVFSYFLCFGCNSTLQCVSEILAHVIASIDRHYKRKQCNTSIQYNFSAFSYFFFKSRFQTTETQSLWLSLLMPQKGK